jgi:glutaredoxin
MSPLVALYTRPGCQHCQQVKDYLDRLGVQYQERDISRDTGAAEDLRQINAPGLPVTVIEGEAVLGFDEPRLADLLKANGAQATVLSRPSIFTRSSGRSSPVFANFSR